MKCDFKKIILFSLIVLVAKLSWSQEIAKIGLSEHSITSIAVFDSIIFVACYNRGLFLSKNNGASWDEVASIECSDIIINKQNPNEIYAVSGTDIYISTNRGVKFNLLKSIHSVLINTIILCQSQSNAIIIGTSNGVYKSFDYGKTFTTAGLQDQNIVSLTTNLSHQSPIIYAATEEGGIFKTCNYGLSWSPVKLTTSKIELTKILVDPKFPNLIYLATIQSGIYVLDDNALSWTKIEFEKEYEMLPMLTAGYEQSNNQSILFLVNTSGNVAISIDQGKTLKRIKDLLPNSICTAIGVSPFNPSCLIIGTTNGIFKLYL